MICLKSNKSLNTLMIINPIVIVNCAILISAFFYVTYFNLI